jgi:magnesium transporter
MIRKIRRLPKVRNKTATKEYYHQPGTIPGTIIIDEDAEHPNN